MITKKVLKSFLEEISTGAKFQTFDFESAERFTVLIKCQVEENQTPEFYGQCASEWINKFSKFTSTTWIVRQCFRKLKRLLYRKIYVCHRSSFNKSIKPDFATRNQECKAKVEFRMKFINRNTIKNDPLLKEGLNLTISIDFTHSHKVHAPEAFMLLKSTSETDEAFLEYFDNGCSALAAKKYHELVLMDKYGEECSDVLSNATINPTLRHVTHIYSKKKKEFGGHEYIFAELIPGKKVMLKAAGYDIDYIEDDYGNDRYWNIVTIITPMMKRVLTKCNLDHLWLDYVNIPNGDSIFFFYVPSIVGPLPAACFMQNRNKNLLGSFSMIHAALEDGSGKTIDTKKMVFSDLQEHRVYMMPGFFRNAKILTSRTWLCSEIWRWLNDDDNKLERKKRPNVMVLIKAMIYADSLEDAEKMYNDLRNHKYVTSNSKLEEYIEDLWGKHDQWLYLEEDKHLTNDLSEMIVRHTREFIVKKCKGFNMCLMMDVVTNIMEKHFRRLLLSIIKGSKTVSTMTKFLDKAKIVLGFGSDVRRISSHEFRIEVQQATKRYLHFRTDTMCCDCVDGKKGHFCEHLAAIVNIIECEQMKIPELTEEEISLFTNIVGEDAEMDEIKPEIAEEKKCVDISDDIENLLTDVNQDKETTTELTENEPESDPSYPESESQGNYYHLEIKTEPLKDDPLEEEFDEISDNVSNDEPSTTTRQPLELKRNYENALKSMNDEFRRLNKLFRNNPNKSNLTSMIQLTSELNKIRPVEKVNLKNIKMRLNDTGKKRRLS